MVFVIRTSKGFPALRKIYDKSSWYKIKVLYKQFFDFNPTLGVFLPLAAVVIPCLATVALRMKLQDVRPKYNDTIVILRPDDPKVEEISKTDNLRIKFIPTCMPAVYLHSV